MIMVAPWPLKRGRVAPSESCLAARRHWQPMPKERPLTALVHENPKSMRNHALQPGGVVPHVLDVCVVISVHECPSV